jgi:predicted RNase H-like nuclease
MLLRKRSSGTCCVCPGRVASFAPHQMVMSWILDWHSPETSIILINAPSFYPEHWLDERVKKGLPREHDRERTSETISRMLLRKRSSGTCCVCPGRVASFAPHQMLPYYSPETSIILINAPSFYPEHWLDERVKKGLPREVQAVRPDRCGVVLAHSLDLSCDGGIGIGDGHSELS